MKIRAKVRGAKELHRALTGLSRQNMRNVQLRALKTVGKEFADYAAVLAPRDTGLLEEGIGVDARSKNKATLASGRIRRAKGAKPVTVAVGPSYRNRSAVPQEFGTEDHAAHPFMRPTLDALDEQIIEKLSQELWAEIRKTALRLAAKGRR